VALSLIQNKVKYVYIEMDHKKFFTVQVPIDNPKSETPVRHYRQRAFLDDDSSYSRRSMTPIGGGPSLDSSRSQRKNNQHRASFNMDQFHRRGSNSDWS